MPDGQQPNLRACPVRRRLPYSIRRGAVDHEARHDLLPRLRGKQHSGRHLLFQATSATGPFTYGGTIMKAAGASFTNHTGIIDFNGHSYFFYHDGALQKGGSVPSNGDGYHRSVCLEEFNYNSDGSFPTIAPTSAGPQAIANLNPFLQTEAETIAWESGVQTEVTSDTGGGMDVTAIDNGDYIRYRSVDFGAGATSFDARVASSTSGGSIELHLDSLSGTRIGTCAVSGTGGAQTWTTKSCASPARRESTICS